MALLLDTNAFLWFAERNPRLGKRAYAAIESGREGVALSAVSIFEIATKHAIGRLDLKRPLPDLVARAYAIGHFMALPLHDRHAIVAGDLPLIHRDPFDRMLIAQARVENLKMVTADRIFAQYQVEIVPADR